MKKIKIFFFLLKFSLLSLLSSSHSFADPSVVALYSKGNEPFQGSLVGWIKPKSNSSLGKVFAVSTDGVSAPHNASLASLTKTWTWMREEDVDKNDALEPYFGIGILNFAVRTHDGFQSRFSISKAYLYHDLSRVDIDVDVNSKKVTFKLSGPHLNNEIYEQDLIQG